MPKKVLVIGSGGREQALAWKLAQSPHVNKVYVAPGNGGSTGIIENVDIGFTAGKDLLNFAKKNSIDLTVIGQEAASEAGVVDLFRRSGLKIFGPSRAAVKIESSKAFAKALMSTKQIPTAAYKTFSSAAKALTYALNRPLPIVIKADGLAEGKGVSVCTTASEIKSAIDRIMVQNTFGDAGNVVVIEDFLKGQEVSIHALSDGHRSVIFPASQDHKQIYDGDKGPNTGGIGVIAPVPWVTKKHMSTIKDLIIDPVLDGLAKQQATFIGCLYPGLMIDGDTVNVVEYNARFGDPEAEVYMRLLNSDLYEILVDCTNGSLDPTRIKWRPGYAVTVVLCSRGYPGSYPKGLPITGIAAAEELDDIVIFHAGTTVKDKQLITNGGRVLNITSIGNTLDEALHKAYDAVKHIHFDGMQYRTDIGRRSTPKT
jgi:phosphoribosylamine--glycine ligase